MSEERKKKHRENYYKHRDSILEKKKIKYQTPEEKERVKQYHKEYHQRPEVKAHRKERDSTPEAIELRKIKDKIHYDKHREKKLAQKKEYYDKTYVRTNRDWRPIIISAKEQLEYYTSLGIKPTLRSMFYRLLSLEKISGTSNDYRALSERLREAREYKIRGIEEKDRYFTTLEIDCFADDTRQATRYTSELEEWQPEKRVSDLVNKLDKIPNDFKISRWLNQPHYVEIWIEKRAMLSTFEGLIRGREVDIVPFGGFHSVPYLHDNSNILKAYQGLVRFVGQDDYLRERKIHILYFGDFDPTGEKIEEVLRQRLDDYGVYDIDFQRIGVTKKQVDDFKLPKDPDAKTLKKLLGDEKKKGDSNVPAFIEKYGGLYQVEVDALPAKKPEEFRNMVINNIDKYFDEEIYQQELEKYPIEKIRELVNKSVRNKFSVT